ncbi:winged helix-turn-helix domain-containing protein [Tahibacter sp.]|uniref:nSTAND1 domain-containing NTPase n=1 Tax=Tahibacter sp. TaxID=2056211 RepID=UPI0028C4839D|nr:winged helix-turn-helix domain-containing protein [Tahibacter sp.]
MAQAGHSAIPRFRFGDWLVEPEAGAIERAGARVAVEPRLMDVLVVLCERGGEVVSAEQLLIECWRGTFYGDNPVHKTIAQLRRALGDSATEPRYIATVRKRGYCVVADVTFPERYAGPGGRAAPRWADGSPYVGLGAFEASHRHVFFGRARAQAEVLTLLRRRLDEERGFLLVLGPSGCGKSSLLRAGVVPLLTQPGGFDGCRVLACAGIDGAQAGADALAALAEAMLGWQVDGQALFLPGERDLLCAELAGNPAALAARVGERLARRHAPSPGARQIVLLQLDQLEQCLLAAGDDATQPQRLFQTLAGLLRGGHVAVLAACRDDFYPRLVALPALVALKADGGSFDLPLLNPGELAQIIRAPALAAGLRFEFDAASSLRLDDVLRDAAVRQPQPLPLLQHALLEIYRQRAGGTLTFAAYRAIGGLEGALAQRAEQTFAGLSAAAQRQLPGVLRVMVMLTLAGDDALPVGRRVAWSELTEVPARELVQAFVEQRLFVAAGGADVPGVAAAHESLFRNWPRARDWVGENRRLLLARARLAAAWRRWRDEGRPRDFLLPPGSQLDDARQLLADAPPLDEGLREFVGESVRRWRRQRRRAFVAIALVLVSALAASVAGALAVLARAEADRRRVEAEGLVGYMLGDLTERLRGLGKLDVLDSVGNEALNYLVALPEDDSSLSTQLLRIRASRQIGEIRFARAEPAAVAAFSHALDLAERLVQREPAAADAWLELGNAAFWRGQSAFQDGDVATAATHWQRYHAAARRLLALRPGDAKAQLELSYALNNLATLDFQALRLDEARARFAESSALKREVLRAQPGDESVIADLADSLTWQGQVDEADARLAAAESLQRAALEMIQRLRTASPDDQRWIHREALARHHLARTLLARGDAGTSSALLVDAHDALHGLVASDASNREWKRDAALAGLHAGIALSDAQPGRARDYLRASQAQLQALAAEGEGGDVPALESLARLRLLYLSAPAVPVRAAQLDAIAATLRGRASGGSFGAKVLVEVLLARAASPDSPPRREAPSSAMSSAPSPPSASSAPADATGAVDTSAATDPAIASTATATPSAVAAQAVAPPESSTASATTDALAEARRLLAAPQFGSDADTLALRLRAALLAGDTPAAGSLRDALAAAGYRHPDHQHFLHDHPPKE